ncbi:DUF6794 domain-containing protein [Undibacterium pigrum]|uniref:DUF6794 domain-containing protein n=1 Tax=Undibacterium pigrum TaxID=401470 RepID=A0A318J268_9BURK|nr:DUF6794 domain-containing protein [Undibacterium pigrum]PXX41494.1 hypothetical protein DFR42_107145 [Undibacterium pigrum]
MNRIISGICFSFIFIITACANTAWALDSSTPVASATVGANNASEASATCATPGKNGYDKDCKRYPDADKWPTSCEQAATEILARFDEASRKRVRDSRYEDLIQFHMGWGMGIRNSTGLWRGNVALIDSCSALDKDSERHPDTISHIIIQQIWKKLH